MDEMKGWFSHLREFLYFLWAFIWNPPLRLEDGTIEQADRGMYWSLAMTCDLFWRTKYVPWEEVKKGLGL
jgi:hypothetical protein